ncbi:uncharacterized protein HD556DRAFT_1308785 [Suillus plorans]|uniref:BAH domain-containing protein n=1 Tax=Suillus plorans TaxID=116603 RepID=A0A9P7ANS1_9AGAM|nr:uncharacterized protein HD556DRAFT_1308785 [Suillus plorans]KAG1793365.1 hypothetical protein HD556DRAFT_1308785 [Suillus plorans]
MSDEDMETKYGYEVGQSVAVYAYQKGRRGVDESDLWYGKIESLRVDKRAKASQPFWVKIRWYWSADFQEPSFKKASQLDSRFFCIGSQELLESDLSEWMEAAVLADVTEVVKFDEISGVLKPWDGLYTRWSASSSPPKLQTRRSNGSAQIATGGIIFRCLDALSPLGSIKSHLPPTEVQAHHKVGPTFQSTHCCPVERGITAGVFGNGWGIHQARQWYNQLVNEGHHLPDDWIMQMDQIDTRWIAPTKNLANTTYYQCPACPKYWL